MAGIGATVVGCAIYVPAYFSTERTITATVTGKERVVQGTGDGMSSRFIVFTDQGEFEVVDSLLYFDWRAASRYGALVEGQRCEMTVAGWRWGFGSWYPNVVEVRGCAA